MQIKKHEAVFSIVQEKFKSLTTPNVSRMYYNGQSQIILVKGFIGMALKKDACYSKIENKHVL